MARRPLALACALLLLAVPALAKKDGAKSKSKSKSFHPVVMTDPASCAGTYVGIDSLYLVEIRLVAGYLEVTVHEGDRATPLERVILSGADLEGSFPNAGGPSRFFEATFVDRELNGDHAFGLMVYQPMNLPDDVTLESIFCRRR